MSELSDEELLRRAVRNATGPGLHPRWACVCSVFAVGSNYAQALCRRFGLDPDESVGEAYPPEDGALDEVELSDDGSSPTEDP